MIDGKLTPYQLVPKLFMLGIDKEGNPTPMNVEAYPYLEAPYNTRCNEVCLFTGRQIAKSTTLANKMVLKAVLQPKSSQIYVAPLQDQAEEFSTKRLQEFLHNSPIIKNGFFSGSGMIDQVFRKRLSNGSVIACGYAQRTADRLRGRSAGDLYFDEIADIMPEVIPVIKELAFRVIDPSFWYCGTPKSLNNHMETMRASSTGNEWAVKCPAMGCGKWNLRWTEKNIGDTGVICEHCGKPLDTDRGQWVSARRLDLEKGKSAVVTKESYRIPQLIVKPIMSIPQKWRELLDKLRDYPTSKLYNEVFGLPFDSASQPITLEQLIRCCRADKFTQNIPPPKNSPKVPALCMGVDWAFIGENSYTFLVIGGWNPYPVKFDVFYWKIFKGQETDPDLQEKQIIQLFHQCGIRLIGADWGAGHVQNLHLINTLGEDRVAQLWHTGLNASGRKTQRAKWEPKTRKWHLARTAVLTDTFENLRRAQVTFPQHSECTEFFDHILAEALEYKPETNVSRYVNAKPDDGLHALTYAMLAGELLVRGDFAGHDGSGSVRNVGGAKHDLAGTDGWGVDDDMYQS
jgi:hypothetical protein